MRLDRLGPGPADRVERPARRKRDDQWDRPRRISLRAGKARARGRDGPTGQHADNLPTRIAHEAVSCRAEARLGHNQREFNPTPSTSLVARKPVFVASTESPGLLALSTTGASCASLT